MMKVGVSNFRVAFSQNIYFNLTTYKNNSYIMKKKLIIILAFIGSPFYCFPQFFPSGGYQNGHYGNGGDEKAQNHGHMLETHVFLEGPFDISDMHTHLNDAGLLPLNQPFNNSPWNYPGIESVASIPNADIVDWLLVELRDASNAALAIPSTTIEKQAVFLKSDGSIVDMDGASFPIFNATITQKLFVVIWHRNHLGIISSNPPIETGYVYVYDYTTSALQAYGTDPQKNIGGGIYGMLAGDANADGTINNNDIIGPWSSTAGESGYINADVDLNGQADNKDKDDVWILNTGMNSQVPD